MKREVPGWCKGLVRDISDKRLISKTYKELLHSIMRPKIKKKIGKIDISPKIHRC